FRNFQWFISLFHVFNYSLPSLSVDDVTFSAVVAAAARVARAPSVALIVFSPFVAIVVRALSVVLLSYELLPRRSHRCFLSPHQSLRLLLHHQSTVDADQLEGSVTSLSNLDDFDSSKYLVRKNVQESLENLWLVEINVATIAWLEADSLCGSHSIAIPLVLVLPYLFCLNQCLRQYKDTGEKTCLLNGSYTKWERYTVEDAYEIVNFSRMR
ncbi:hypothetical protein S83_004831, partial [Arachis hypogaea]